MQLPSGENRRDWPANEIPVLEVLEVKAAQIQTRTTVDHRLGPEKLITSQVVKPGGTVHVGSLAVQPESNLIFPGDFLPLGKPGLPVPENLLLGQLERLHHLPIGGGPPWIVDRLHPIIAWRHLDAPDYVRPGDHNKGRSIVMPTPPGYAVVQPTVGEEILELPMVIVLLRMPAFRVGNQHRQTGACVLPPLRATSEATLKVKEEVTPVAALRVLPVFRGQEIPETPAPVGTLTRQKTRVQFPKIGKKPEVLTGLTLSNNQGPPS